MPSVTMVCVRLYRGQEEVILKVNMEKDCTEQGEEAVRDNHGSCERVRSLQGEGRLESHLLEPMEDKGGTAGTPP